MRIFILLVTASVIRLFLAALFPLTADESYYWLWSKHLSLSYVDHPPMIAYLNFLFTFGKENLFALRLGAVTITLLVSILIYFIAKEAFNEKVAFWSVVLFQIIPHFVVVWLTMFVELPLVLFWSISMLVLAKIIKRNRDVQSQVPLWYLLGITVGLGYLSKYTMFLFWPCLSVFLLISPDNRTWLRKKELYLCFLLSLFFFLPVIYWNSQHSWASFTFHGGKATADPWGANVLPFITDQLVHFTPFLIFLLPAVLIYGLKHNERTKFLSCFSLPILVFLAFSLKIKVWAHWPSLGYIAALPLTVNYLIENGKSLKKFIVWITCFSLLILVILLFLSPGVLLHQRDYAQNYHLPKAIPSGLKIFAKTNVSASLLEFYLRRPIYLATGLLKPHPLWGEEQYEIWEIPNLKRGENIIYYGEANLEFQKYFKNVSEAPEIKLHLVEDYLSKFKTFKLEGFKGITSHP